MASPQRIATEMLDVTARVRPFDLAATLDHVEARAEEVERAGQHPDAMTAYVKALIGLYANPPSRVLEQQ